MSEHAIVLDASVAIASLRRESAAEALVVFLRGTTSDDRLLVPEHFWLELGNVLVRRYGATPAHVVEALRDVDALGVESVRLDRPLLLVALDLQARFGLSSYDAAYLALAETEDARLLTLDRRLKAAAGPRAVPLPGEPEHRLSEEPAPYGEPVDWASFGSYLAELRAAERTAATRQ